METCSKLIYGIPLIALRLAFYNFYVLLSLESKEFLYICSYFDGECKTISVDGQANLASAFFGGATLDCLSIKYTYVMEPTMDIFPYDQPKDEFSANYYLSMVCMKAFIPIVTFKEESDQACGKKLSGTVLIIGNKPHPFFKRDGKMRRSTSSRNYGQLSFRWQYCKSAAFINKAS